jgi:predicted TIM-barrel fold metal-dependent hydrolase
LNASAISPSDEPPLVDAHFHIYTTDLPLAEGAWHTPAEDAGCARLISLLDEHGVLFGVVAAASLHGHYNDHVRDALRLHKRLRATAVVAPTVSRYELDRMAEDGFVGIRFVWRMRDDPPDITSPDYRMLLRRVADLGWHVHLIERSDRMPGMIRAIEAAGATVVIDHMGLPKPANGLADPAFRAVLDAVERGRAWVKISAGYRLDPPSSATSYAQELIRVTGGERLVWGSDWPFAAFENRMAYAQAIADFRHSVPDAAMRRRIGGRNPLQLYFI